MTSTQNRFYKNVILWFQTWSLFIKKQKSYFSTWEAFIYGNDFCCREKKKGIKVRLNYLFWFYTNEFAFISYVLTSVSVLHFKSENFLYKSSGPYIWDVLTQICLTIQLSFFLASWVESFFTFGLGTSVVLIEQVQTNIMSSVSAVYSK